MCEALPPTHLQISVCHAWVDRYIIAYIYTDESLYAMILALDVYLAGDTRKERMIQHLKSDTTQNLIIMVSKDLEFG